MKRIGIIGCGWLGSRIAVDLAGKYKICTTTTTQEKADKLNAKGLPTTVVAFPDYQLTEGYPQWNEIKTLDIVIITIPVSEKSCCVSSLYNRIQNLSSFIGNFKGQIFLMSSTGVYPDLAKEFTEDDVPFEKVSGERMIRNRYPQANVLRLGGLMGDNRLLKNYTIDNLEAAVNHIHYKDIGGILLKMIENGTERCLYNVTAPLHPSKSQVISEQKNTENREEVTDAKGKKVLSSKLISELEYVFQYPDPRYFHL
ncbi:MULTISPECIES: hypothetical protein [unclassified Chryseobacterium]|uniref:hypothetical protein n=1 Tax=unclassified Chryseobacterium TaxID=2593645 RepID=UPI000F4560BA|nr:hypothetical protein [Chryseobacterium sp. G0240]ROI05182.1 hypothetical protein EGI16_07660 [Chryseobacterium sp. G0240]